MNAVTNAELDAFYGVPATQFEITQAINKHVFAFDSDDMQQIVIESFDDINRALLDGDEMEAGRIIQVRRRALIAQRASMSVYGKPDVITADQVHV